MSIYTDAQTLQSNTAAANAAAASTQAAADTANAALFVTERSQLATVASEMAAIPGLVVTYPPSGDSVLVATLSQPAGNGRPGFEGVLNLAVIPFIQTNPPVVPEPEPTFQFQLLWDNNYRSGNTTEEITTGEDFLINSDPATNLYASDITSFRALVTSFVASRLI